MDKQIQFIQIQKDNEAHFQMASGLWIPYMREISEHDGISRFEGCITAELKKRIGIQGSRRDMHFEIVLVDGEPAGIAMFAIDLGTVYGLLEKGFGTIMEFYIRPDFRRRGIGTIFSCHAEEVLRQDGAANVYLCPDAVTGKPFWEAKGYSDSGKIDPDNQKPIYIKAL